jgi:hypothetical protein
MPSSNTRRTAGCRNKGGLGYLESADRSIVAFPDAHIDVLDVKAHGDFVFDVELLASGTHRGVLDLGAYGRKRGRAQMPALSSSCIRRPAEAGRYILKS